jgi:hypothetical protein
MATKRFRQKNIAMLKDAYGTEITDHEKMAGML